MSNLLLSILGDISMAELTICNLSHFYKRHQALCEVSATLNNGVVALIGPNGAGKTTLINSIVGLLKPFQGEILFNGQNIHELGKCFYENIGYCPQAPRFYPNFTAREFLIYMGVIKGIPSSVLDSRIDELLAMVNLLQRQKSKISTFSGGMKQRLGIAQALLNNPPLLILDEPTAGLDPNERIRFRNLLSEISANRIVILATHIISDVESIASQILLLKQGKLIVDASPNEVLTRLSEFVWIIPDVKAAELSKCAEQHLISNVRKTTNDQYELKIVSDVQPTINAICGTPSLEDAFLYYFHEKLEE